MSISSRALLREKKRISSDTVADSLIKDKSRGVQPEKIATTVPKKKNRPPPAGENPDDIIVGSSRRSRNASEKMKGQTAK